MATFKTVLHHYRFDSGKHPGYKEMVAKIQANADGRGHWMNALAMPGEKRMGEPGPSEVVEIKTDHIFGNQWNTADGRRVFDWYEAIFDNRNLKAGHWLEITPELAELRRATHVCGYCGKHYGPHHEPIPEGRFCTACLDSEYLKPEELHLLRLKPVCETIKSVYHYDKSEREPLTEAERAELMARYVERQTTGSDSRAKKKRDQQRADVLAKFEKETTAATEERDGMLWLWDRGISLDNVIYYDHTRTFSFGWRSPVSPEVKSKLLDLLCEFAFAYEIKAADGKVSTK